MELIRATDVTFSYADRPVLANVNLSVEPGEIVSLLGPNGSGKTTLLKLILGIFSPDSGAVLFNGRPLKEITPRQLARKVAYVPQFHRMAFAYRVTDVVLMGRMPHKPLLSRYNAADKEAACHAMEKMSLTALKDKNYTEISGGERQRVLIARALAQGADILIMDEPAASLDFGNQIRLLEQIRLLAAEGYTFVKATHFPDHALWIADRVVMLQNGKVLADGRPGDVLIEERVCGLYDTKVTIANIAPGIKTCIPRFFSEKGQRNQERLSIEKG